MIVWQWKEDKRVEKEKKGLTFLLIFISSPREKKRPAYSKAGIKFFNTSFKTPDIYDCGTKERNSHAKRVFFFSSETISKSDDVTI